LITHLDLDAGAYGWSHEIRAELVGVARSNARLRFGRDYDRIVLVGDTPEDVGAALSSGAGVVGVATGRYTVAELQTAGAHVALADLSDTGRVEEAITAAAR
jgi:beta-phosphoglucomutase-like phosphatase (HAD superfamily)